eukprot:4868579-Ditylum_brightwellii.AAC.1
MIVNMKEGWVGKPKGMANIVFERGFIDVQNINLYSKDSPKDDDKQTLLQHMTTKVGIALGLNVM